VSASVQESGADRRSRLTPARAWLLAVLAIVVVLALVAWLQRKDIARGYADDLLRQRGVPARYEIAGLGFGGQRLTNVVLGDPANPDLTADWIETRTRIGLGGARVIAIRAGRVRLRGRVVDGRISLGAVDRLLPAPSGVPFAFPDIALEVADGRMRLDAPAGPVGLKLSGGGHLRDGFAGTLAAVAPALDVAGCALRGATAYGRVRIVEAAPRFVGPVRLQAGTCVGYRLASARLDLDGALTARLNGWRGSARLAAAELRGGQMWLKQLAGEGGFAGDARATSGKLKLRAGPSAAFGASAAGVSLAGDYRLGERAGFAGEAAFDRASLPARWRARLAGLRGGAAGTPAGPLLDRAIAALAAAGRDADGTAGLAISRATTGWQAQLTRLDLAAASGARIGFGGGQGIEAGAGGVRIDGTLRVAGGGLPDVTTTLTQAAPGAPLSGTARVGVYRAGDSTLALAPVTFRATPGGRTFFSTRASLSGPLGDGRVEGLSLPLQGGWDGRGRLVLNAICAPLGVRRLAIAGLVLDPTVLRLCPTGAALLTLDDGRLNGGARVVAPRLAGRLGNGRFTAAAASGEVRLGTGDLRIDRLALRLGQPPAQSRLDLGTLTGRFAGGGVAGRYSGGAGQVGAVPLLLSDAAGDWALRSGVLTVGGALTVSDAQVAAPRLNPLPVRDVRLTLKGGRIDATGQLRAPDGMTRVADLTLAHDLSRGVGEARIAVPGVTFGEALRPNQLTPVVSGLVAGVRGAVTGSGMIRWTPQGVTSTGDFATDGMNLAAAFGPITGLRTRIHFTDLLALESAPGQVATTEIVNPGVPVKDGVFRFQTLSGARIRVEGARWPLAGGELILEPTLLDFSAPVERRTTFRIVGLDARQFLQTFGYDNLDASGVFDGVLPIVFDAQGGSLVDGRLTARPGGGTLAYRGEISKENLGTWGNMAFGALRSLRFRELELTLDGPLAGNIVTRARFAGVAQGEGAQSNFLIRRLAKLPFVFNVRIEAPFRALIGSVRSFYDPSILIEQNLPMLLREQERAEQQDKPIQPPASENKP
jgi:hypothetical protein